jgi:hypothetical protein
MQVQPGRNTSATIALLLPILFATVLPATAGRADCGFAHVALEGTASEVERGCVALAKVLEAFAAMGFEIDPQFSLVFKDQVFVEMIDEQQQSERQLLQVAGFFDARRRLMEVTSFASAHQEDRQLWGVSWGPEIAESILHHELAHMATLEVLGESYWRTGRAWLEFIAYGIEFEVMAPLLKAQIFANNPTAKAFDGELEVNAVLHAADPDQFGLRSYLMADANGGLQFIRRLLADEVSFSRSDILWRR